MTWLDLTFSGRNIESRGVLNSFGKSSFDFRLQDGTFIEAKFGTSTLNRGAQTEAANFYKGTGQFELQQWDYPTISGIIGSGASAGISGSTYNDFSQYPSLDSSYAVQPDFLQ